MINDTIDAFCRWASEVLPGTPAELLRKLREETDEFFEQPCDDEAADVVFVLSRWCDAVGIDLAAALERKFAVVKTRTWLRQPDGTFHHIKSHLEKLEPLA